MGEDGKITCPSCGATSAPTKFCGNCGERLADREAPRATAEHRHLTVVFCDLVGSTRLSRQIDAERYRELLASYQQMASDSIVAYEGHVAQYLGDGMLIYFGFPTAHEDDPRRAVMAALAILEGIERINQRGEFPEMAVRIGIHAGMVVAGKVGVGASKNDLALGLAPNVAARLQALAEAGTIVVSDSFRTLVEGFFTSDDLGRHEIKGVPEPLQVHAITGVSTFSRYRASTARGLTPFVGREHETRQLSALWERARDGNFSVALISGEGGIGKSRLTRFISDIALQADGTITDCECSPLHQNTVLFPVVEMVNARFLRLAADDHPDERLVRLENLVEQIGLLASETMPLLASFLNIPFESRYTMPVMGPELQREATLNLLLDIVARMPVPHMMVFEDLQWADATTLELVRRLIEDRRQPSLMVVVNARPEFVPPWPETTISSVLRLERLSDDDLQRLIGHVARDGALPEKTAREIAQTADGIPLFAEELTKSVLESANPDGDTAGQGPVVPESLSASLMSRLDKLGHAREIAQVAAVLGRRFRYDQLRAITQGSDQHLKNALDALISSGLVYPVGVLPHSVYRFNHALVQAAAYDSLLRRARRDLHRVVVERMESTFPEIVATEPELLARHSQRAGMAEKAIDYWMQAGVAAFTRSANIEAAAHLQAGLTLLGEIADPGERGGRELKLLTVLGPSLIATTGFASDEVGKVYDRARELCEQTPGNPETFPVLVGSWVFFLVKGQLETSRRYAVNMLQLGEQTGDDNLLVEAHYSLGNSLYWLGKLDDASAHLAAADDCYDPRAHQSHAFQFGQDPGVAARCYQSFTYWMLGKPAEAFEALEAAVETAEPLNHPFTTAWPMAFYVLMHSHRREPDEARDAAERLIAFAQEQHQVFWLQAAIIVRGWANACSGDVDGGIADIRSGIAAYAGTGAAVSLPHFHGLLVETLIAGDRLDEAETELAGAFDVAKRNGERVAEIGLKRQRAEIASARGDGEAALSACLDAVSLARETNAMGPGLRAAAMLHRLLDDTSTSPLAEFVGHFGTDVDTPDLREARQLLSTRDHYRTGDRHG